MTHTARTSHARLPRLRSGPACGAALVVVTVVRVLTVVMGAAVAGGCGPAPVKALANPDPSGKIPAIKHAAQAHDRRAAAQLVKDLGSDDPAVRFYAIEALKRIVHEDLGFVWYENEDRREPASKRWQEWLAAQ